MIRWCVTLSGSAGLWILFVAGVKPEEMIVGAICVSLTILFSWYIATHCMIQVRLRMVDVIQIYAVPWNIARDAMTVLRVLAKDILHIAPAESLYRAVPYAEVSHQPETIGRRVLAVVYTSAAPNSIVAGIDFKRRQMLFHQLKRNEVANMTRRLGAGA